MEHRISLKKLLRTFCELLVVALCVTPISGCTRTVAKLSFLGSEGVNLENGSAYEIRRDFLISGHGNSCDAAFRDALVQAGAVALADVTIKFVNTPVNSDYSVRGYPVFLKPK